MKKPKAFTLVELLIASGIFLVLMLTVYSSFHTGMLGYRNIEEAIDTYQTARQILERINLDLRNSFAYSGNETKFTGTGNSISFLTLVDTFSEDEIVQDYALVSYTLIDKKLLRQCRKNQESLNENSEVQAEEMASKIEGINFRFGYLNADKLEWSDSWPREGALEDEKKALPVKVEVKLTIKNRIEQVFQRTIFYL